MPNGTYATREEGVADGIPAERLMQVTEVTVDGESTHFFDIGEDLLTKLHDDQAEYARLEAAGTPYWCVCKPERDVTHPAAYWQGDQASGIHRKHGVRCKTCGGYIQEG